MDEYMEKDPMENMDESGGMDEALQEAIANHIDFCESGAQYAQVRMELAEKRFRGQVRWMKFCLILSIALVLFALWGLWKGLNGSADGWYTFTSDLLLAGVWMGLWSLSKASAKDFKKSAEGLRNSRDLLLDSAERLRNVQ